jgi:hypothetical protein
MGVLALATALMREFDERRAVVDEQITSGALDSFEKYKAACARSETWRSAREAVVAALDPADRP